MGRIVNMFLLMVLLVSNASAANNYTPSGTLYEINKLVVYSTNETIYPSWAGFTILSFSQQLIWNTINNCSTSSVAIRIEDKHLISAAQAAYATGKGVRLYVDDAHRIDNSVCILRAFEY